MPHTALGAFIRAGVVIFAVVGLSSGTLATPRLFFPIAPFSTLVLPPGVPFANELNSLDPVEDDASIASLPLDTGPVSLAV